MNISGICSSPLCSGRHASKVHEIITLFIAHNRIFKISARDFKSNLQILSYSKFPFLPQVSPNIFQFWKAVKHSFFLCVKMNYLNLNSFNLQSVQNTRLFGKVHKKLKEDTLIKPVLDYAEKSTKVDRVYLVSGKFIPFL